MKITHLAFLIHKKTGLYRQAAWAANLLNRGYYLWKVSGLSGYILTDGSLVPPSPTINAATAGVQNLFSHYYDYDQWLRAVSAEGFFATYQSLYGFPFDFSIDPLLPPDLIQPPMQLPFEPGAVWSFTGGPHGGWGDGSAWAAIDFAPPGGGLGCVENSSWVVAVADGVVTYAHNGLVILDLDGDGLEQTGWTVIYLHIASYDRVSAGDVLRIGDIIGHPSCEGGYSTGTHIHIARRYNGEWISADGPLPFILDGWVSEGAGVEYNGYLINDGQLVEALDFRSDANQIWR
jgi:murein DD-endopeptidase MepM/ murein hydrolase activator NlpD